MEKNTIPGLPSGWKPFEGPIQTPHKLQQLISNRPYEKALAALQKRKEDCGFTDKWYKDERRKMNAEWLSNVQDAVAENQRYIGEQYTARDKIEAMNYQHNYTERDYADLQFMQTLIKTRIVTEGQSNDTLIGRIISEYINTQVGARAIMFLTGDNEVGKAVLPFYKIATENAKTAAERKFEVDKAAALDKLDKALVPYLQADIIGGAMLTQAQEMVGVGMSEVCDAIYFPDEPQEGEINREENHALF